VARLKWCNYHQGYHDEDDFVMVASGKYGQRKTAQCGLCYRGRKNNDKARLAAIVAENKAANSRAYKLG